jgi:hypothetical protein
VGSRMKTDELIRLLDEPTVQEKIKSWFSDERCDVDFLIEDENIVTLEQTNSQLMLENQNLKKENDEMIKLIHSLKDTLFGKDEKLSDSDAKIKDLTFQLEKLNQTNATKESQVESITKKINDLEKSLDLANKKVNWYRKHFSDDIKVQDIFSDLSEESKRSLSGIFKNTTVNGLIACGIQEKNIGNLWDYAKNEVVNDTNPDINNIIQLFDILFSRFTLAFPMYKSQVVAVGDDFDNQSHIRHGSSQNVSGAIVSVLLIGYSNTKTNKVIKQSLVRI